MTTYTPAGYAKALQKFGTTISRPIANGARAGLRIAEKQAEATFMSRGIGRSIFGGGPKGGAQGPALASKSGKAGAQQLIGVQKVQVLKGRLLGGLFGVGLAALQEEGGKIRPHAIPRLASGGSRVFVTKAGWYLTVNGPGAFRIEHPGGALPKVPAMENAVRHNAGRIAAEIDKRIQQAIDERGL